MRGLSASRTETNTVPSRGSCVPPPIWLLAKAIGERAVEAHDLAGRLHLRAEHGVDAGEAGEREHRLLDPDMVEAWRLQARSLRAISPAMMRAAILATGMPMTLATNGTVREARGLTSST